MTAREESAYRVSATNRIKKKGVRRDKDEQRIKAAAAAVHARHNMRTKFT